MTVNEFQVLLEQLPRFFNNYIGIPSAYYFTRSLIAAKILSPNADMWNDEVLEFALQSYPEKLSFSHEISIHDLRYRFPKHGNELANITYGLADLFCSDEQARQAVLVISFCYKMYVLDMQRYQKEYMIARESLETPVVEVSEMRTPVAEPAEGAGIAFLSQFTPGALGALVSYLLRMKHPEPLSTARLLSEYLWAQLTKTGVISQIRLRLLGYFFIDALPDRFLVKVFPLAIRFNAFCAVLFSAVEHLLRDAFAKFSSTELQEQLLNTTLCDALRTVSETDFTTILKHAITASGGDLRYSGPQIIKYRDCAEEVVATLTPHQATQQLEQMRLFHHLVATEMEFAANLVKTGFIDELKAGRPISEEKREILLTDLKRLRSVVANILPCNAADLRKEYFVSGDDGYFVACQAIIEMFYDICSKNQFLRKLRE